MVAVGDDVIGGWSGGDDVTVAETNTSGVAREAPVRRQAGEVDLQETDSAGRQHVRVADRPHRTAPHQHHRRRESVVIIGGGAYWAGRAAARPLFGSCGPPLSLARALFWAM